MLVNSSGSVSWVSETGWKTLQPRHLSKRRKPLVAPTKKGLLVYGGEDDQANVLCDGIIINIITNTVTQYFRQPEMPLYSFCSGRISPQGEVIAFGADR